MAIALPVARCALVSNDGRLHDPTRASEAMVLTGRRYVPLTRTRHARAALGRGRQAFT